ncbi:hypothetical protein Q0590_16050 [Rhodocytophaga aerolata]|uniref:Glycosyltransferase RgtA/B/C/D-like domain-containing protein n=2 Tax=Rhodocytophaga aerolata TaxID=455078 RepID=A0ABT8R6Q4_9BACT|nr:hypothetical protein [Rhodocytophaga aerolata]MDO1447785.1 hypothetical protein [Rhodocytophaga aerolata]
MINKISFHTVITIISCFIIAALVYYAGSKYGPGITFDSINYVYAGHSLAEKGELLRPFQTPFIEWPPLYPLLIAMVSYVPGSILTNLFYFQILIAALTVALSCSLARKMIRNNILFVIACLSLAFSTPLILVNHFIWSESFFSILVVLQLQLFICYLQKPSWQLYMLLVISGLLLCVQRQVGAFFVAGGACILCIYPSSIPFSKKLIISLCYALLAAVLPLLLWWIRNYQLRGLLMNDYRDTLFLTSFFSHLGIYHDIVTSWLLPDELPIWLRVLLLYGLLFFLAFIYVYYRKSITHQPVVAVLSILFWSYFVLLFLISFIVTEQIDDRKLAPIYVPGMLLLFSLVDVYSRNKQPGRTHWVIYICLLWTIYPVTRALYNVHAWHQTAMPAELPQPVEESFKDNLRFY